MATILLVTNNADIRELFMFILSSQHQIVEAKDGKEGIELFELYKPEIIVTDLSMPVMDGYDFVKHLRATKLSVKIIAFSTYFTCSNERKRMLRAGADLCIAIPVDPALLAQAVKTVWTS